MHAPQRAPPGLGRAQIGHAGPTAGSSSRHPVQINAFPLGPAQIRQSCGIAKLASARPSSENRTDVECDGFRWGRVSVTVQKTVTLD